MFILATGNSITVLAQNFLESPTKGPCDALTNLRGGWNQGSTHKKENKKGVQNQSPIVCVLLSVAQAGHLGSAGDDNIDSRKKENHKKVKAKEQEAT